MGLDISKLNSFNPAMQGLKGVQTAQPQAMQPINATSSVGKNPFQNNNKNEQFGVGLVQSNLENMAYTLPDGQKSKCNTICIA